MSALTTWLAVLGLALAAGCKSQAPEPPMVCAKILPAAIDGIMADRAGDPRVAAVIERAKHDYVAVCEADKWSRAIGECIEAATKPATTDAGPVPADKDAARKRTAMDRCRGGLDKAQSEHFDAATRKLRAAVEQATPAPAPAPAPAPEATGSGS